MKFKEFIQMCEAGENPVLKNVARQVGQTVANKAAAPSTKDQTAGDIAKGAMLDVAKTGKAAEIEALTQATKGPMLKPGMRMMKKK